MGNHYATFCRLAACCAVLSTVAIAAVDQGPAPRIVQPINESQLTVLKGNVHPLARPQFDRGIAPPDLPMQRMLLVLQRSRQQQAALTQLLDDQQNHASPNFHKWLTPEQFGKQFGPADQDIQTVTSWLRSHGFEVGNVSNGRTMIEFSGTAAQVQEALHTSIHKYVVNGKEHWANASDPQIPTALVPVVAGVHTLHNFLKQPMVQLTGQKVTAKVAAGKAPQITLGNGTHALVPTDFATIYDIEPLYNANAPIDGAGVVIGVVGRSDLWSDDGYQDGLDFYDFRQYFSPDGRSGYNLDIIYNGPNPGDLGGGEEVEATLDVSWAGTIAVEAGISLIVSATTNTTDGVDLSELYIVDNNFADVMTESFGRCEAATTSTEEQGIAMLAQQAAAQGISYVVATGDTGAEGCDDANIETVARGPISVNALAATPYNVAVGGTQFNENNDENKYWASTDNAYGGSALSYIPEDVWNQSCPAANCGKNANIWAGSGGASAFFSKPTWQSGIPGIPNDGRRDIPDVAFTAAGAHDPYVICLEGSCQPNANGEIYLYFVGGTSASTPSFAGIMAIADERMSNFNIPITRQGNPNPVLYSMAGKASGQLSQCNGSNASSLPAKSCIFDDVTAGNNEVPGEEGYPRAPYSSGVGYDLATGLGSLKVANFVASWASRPVAGTTTTLQLSPTSITHGQPVQVDIAVTSQQPGQPTGTVSLVTSCLTAYQSIQGVLLSNSTLTDGSLSTTTYDLPGGRCNVAAYYYGDGHFAPSYSAYQLITTGPEASVTRLSVCSDPTPSNICPPFTGGPYGSFTYLSARVSSATQPCPPDCSPATGNLAVLSNGSKIIWGPSAPNSQNILVTPAGIALPTGTYSLTAQYYGDPTYIESVSSPPYSVTITPAPSSTKVTYAGAPKGAAITITVNGNGLGAGPSGTVNVLVNGQVADKAAALQSYPANIDPLTGQILPGYSIATFNDTALENGLTYDLTAVYSGDQNYKPSSSPSTAASLQPDFAFVLGATGVDISAPGQSGNFPFAITANDGFNSVVNFTCSGLPAGATCTFSPTSITGGGQLNLTITTTASASSSSSMPRQDPLHTGPSFATLAASTIFGIVLLGAPRNRRRRISFLLPLLLLCALLIASINCGGGGGSQSTQTQTPPPPTPPASPTPTGAYNITVTATSGSISHPVEFTLNVL
jgi:hypothetical protein